MFINLFGNVVKYMLCGCVELCVCVGLGDEIVFEIVDIGFGIVVED